MNFCVLEEAFAAQSFLPSCGPTSETKGSLYSQIFGAASGPSEEVVHDRDVASTSRSVSGNHRKNDKPSTRSKSAWQTFLQRGNQRLPARKPAVLRRSGGLSAGLPSGLRAGLPSGL
jgi:hypothetical protein